MTLPFAITVVIKFPFLLCSFGMAYDFIDCIGDDVDVVSDSEVCGAVAKKSNKSNISFFGSETCPHTHLMLTLFSHHVQNIKKLLKIPYSKSHVSMAVHRVGRTLLLDELDIQELFMRSSQVRHSLLQTFIRYVCH